MPTQSAANLATALDLANALRMEFGQPLLHELPLGSSMPNEPTMCVLARALNFDCYVTYDAEELPHDIREQYPEDHEEFGFGGWVLFGRKDVAEALAGQLGVDVMVTNHDPYGDGTPDDLYYVPLPDEVAAIANEFDSARGRWRLDELARDLGWSDLYEDDE